MLDYSRILGIFGGYSRNASAAPPKRLSIAFARRLELLHKKDRQFMQGAVYQRPELLVGFVPGEAEAGF